MRAAGGDFFLRHVRNSHDLTDALTAALPATQTTEAQAAPHTLLRALWTDARAAVVHSALSCSRVRGLHGDGRRGTRRSVGGATVAGGAAVGVVVPANHARSELGATGATPGAAGEGLGCCCCRWRACRSRSCRRRFSVAGSSGALTPRSLSSWPITSSSSEGSLSCTNSLSLPLPLPSDAEPPPAPRCLFSDARWAHCLLFFPYGIVRVSLMRGTYAKHLLTANETWKMVESRL